MIHWWQSFTKQLDQVQCIIWPVKFDENKRVKLCVSFTQHLLKMIILKHCCTLVELTLSSQSFWTLPSKNLWTSTGANRGFSLKKKKNRKANRVDPDKTSCLDLHCLHRYLFWSARLKGLKYRNSPKYWDRQDEQWRPRFKIKVCTVNYSFISFSKVKPFQQFGKGA